MRGLKHGQAELARGFRLAPVPEFIVGIAVKASIDRDAPAGFALEQERAGPNVVIVDSGLIREPASQCGHPSERNLRSHDGQIPRGVTEEDGQYRENSHPRAAPW